MLPFFTDLAPMALPSGIAVGAGLGLLYDLFRFRRVKAPRPKEKKRPLSVLLTEEQPTKRRFSDIGQKLAVLAEDLLFSLICAISVSVYLFCANRGRVRLLLLALCFFGFLLYRMTVSDRLILLMRRLFALEKRVLSRLLSPGLRLLRAGENALLRRYRRWRTVCRLRRGQALCDTLFGLVPKEKKLKTKRLCRKDKISKRGGRSHQATTAT